MLLLLLVWFVCKALIKPRCFDSGKGRFAERGSTWRYHTKYGMDFAVNIAKSIPYFVDEIASQCYTLSKR